MSALIDRGERLLRRIVRNDQVVLALIAVLVGTAAGYGALLFREVVSQIQHLFYDERGRALVDVVQSMPWWLVIATPAAGGLAIGILCRFVLSGPQPQGVAHVIEANALRNGRMPFRSGIGAAFISAASIGCGASVGREGPIVHLGAVLASAVSRALRLGPSLARTLMGCGVAAAIAAAFNAPIAGVLFALEVVIGHYGLGAFSPVVIASVMGTTITRIHIGDAPAFTVPIQIIASFWELPAFALLGVLCGLVALLLIRSVAVVEAAHDRLRIPAWVRPAIAGLIVGVIALGYPEVLGVGYEATDRTLRGLHPLDLMIFLAIAKCAATAVCLGSRFGGGIFSPSLVLGALVGGAFGVIAAGVFPELSSESGTYSIVAMGAVAAAVLGAPVSTIIMIFELTLNYAVTFAVMITVAIACVLTRQLGISSFFHWQLAQRGISAAGQLEIGLLQSRTVAGLMRRDHVEVGLETPLETLKARFRGSHAPIFVLDDEGRLHGIIEFGDLADAAFDPEAGDGTVAEDIAHRPAVVLEPGENLASALERCRATAIEHIPVVDSRDSRRVLGEVRQSDLIRAYNRALLDARAQERGET